MRYASGRAFRKSLEEGAALARLILDPVTKGQARGEWHSE